MAAARRIGDEGATAGKEADRQSDAHQGDHPGDDRVLLALGLRHGGDWSFPRSTGHWQGSLRAVAIVAEAPPHSKIRSARTRSAVTLAPSRGVQRCQTHRCPGSAVTVAPSRS